MHKLDTIFRGFLVIITAIYAVGFWVYAVVAETTSFNTFVACAISWLGIVVVNILGDLHLRAKADQRAAERIQKALDDTYGKWETR